MSGVAKHLRVVDAETGEVTEGTDAEVAALRRKLAETEASLVKECRTSAALRGQLSAQKKRTALKREVGEVLGYWHRRCRNGNKQVKVPLDGKRADAVSAMLGAFSVDELKRAVDGAHKFPYEQYGRRFELPGPGRERRDDVTFICANETRVERLIALASADTDREEYRRFVHALCKRHPLLLAALAMLAEREPHGSVLAAAAKWARTELS